MMASVLSDWSTFAAAVAAMIAAALSFWGIKTIRDQWQADKADRAATQRRRQRSILTALRGECEGNAQWWGGGEAGRGMVEPLAMPIWEMSRADLSELDTTLFAQLNASHQAMQRTNTRMEGDRRLLEEQESETLGHRHEFQRQVNKQLRRDFMAPSAEQWKEAIAEIDRVLAMLEESPSP